MKNGTTMHLDAVPSLEMDEFRSVLKGCVAEGCRVASLFAATTHHDLSTVYLVLADDENSEFRVGSTQTIDGHYPSLTPDCPQVHLFEREIAEQSGIIPDGHPWFKPVRYHRTWTGVDGWNRSPHAGIVPGSGDFYRVEGDHVHEVAVGPVHAGVIEPGHFRFQCSGETVHHLEIALGYQHRGIEKALAGGPDPRSLHYAETAAGDTTIGHAMTYCQIIESLTDTKKSARAMTLRGIALELERLANHIGDLGALSGDVGFLPTASYCGRIRGDFLNMTALLCGNRFGRGMIRPGGVAFDLDEERKTELLKRLDVAEKETGSAVKLLWDNSSVMARFEDTGPLPQDVAREIGMVGVAARASGLLRDVRYTHPSGVFSFSQIPVSHFTTGDVFARAYVRWLEIQMSTAFIREQLHKIPTGEIYAPPGVPAPNSISVSMNEGWRGEVCHTAITDKDGHFARYKITDPSFHNWSGLSRAMRGQEISDFPLCNKSFNLSYCGHDL